MIRIRVDVTEFNAIVKALMVRGEDFTPAMKDIGDRLVGSVLENFKQQGRPERWEPLKFSTLVSRYIRGNRDRKKKRSVLVKGGTGFSAGFTRMLGQGKILMDSGILRNSIHGQASRYGVVVGTNLVYSRIHQLGGKAGRGLRTKIPARPYLVIQDADYDYINKALMDYLLERRG